MLLAMFVFSRDLIAKKMFQSCQGYMLGGLSLAVDIDESLQCLVSIRADNGCKSFVW